MWHFKSNVIDRKRHFVATTGLTIGAALVANAAWIGAGALAIGAGVGAYAMAGGFDEKKGPEAVGASELPPMATAPTPESGDKAAKAAMEKQRRMRALSGNRD